MLLSNWRGGGGCKSPSNSSQGLPIGSTLTKPCNKNILFIYLIIYLFINFLIYLIMVTIVEVAERTAANGNVFCSVMVAGDASVHMSAEGKASLVALKASIPSNLPKDVLESMIGNKLPGKVERVETEPYQWVNPNTGEEITLSHTYKYSPEE